MTEPAYVTPRNIDFATIGKLDFPLTPANVLQFLRDSDIEVVAKDPVRKELVARPLFNREMTPEVVQVLKVLRPFIEIALGLVGVESAFHNVEIMGRKRVARSKIARSAKTFRQLVETMPSDTRSQTINGRRVFFDRRHEGADLIVLSRPKPQAVQTPVKREA